MGIVFLAKRRVQAEAIAPHGLTLKQLFLLRFIRRRGPLTPSQAAELLFCDRPTASVVIANCERSGWISRARSARDRRSCALDLTRAGAALLDRIRRARPLAGCGDPLDVLSASERATLGPMLEKVRRRAEELYLSGGAYDA